MRFEVSRTQSKDPQISISPTRNPLRPLGYPFPIKKPDIPGTVSTTMMRGWCRQPEGLRWDDGGLLTLLVVVVSDDDKVVGQTRHRRILLSVLILRLKSSSPTDGRRHLKKPERYSVISHP